MLLELILVCPTALCSVGFGVMLCMAAAPALLHDKGTESSKTSLRPLSQSPGVALIGQEIVHPSTNNHGHRNGMC